jgi:hypothetical protein
MSAFVAYVTNPAIISRTAEKADLSTKANVKKKKKKKIKKKKKKKIKKYY